MHPLDKFVFCPVCGSPQFEVNNVKSKRCKACGFIYYANPYSATAAFILRTPEEGGEKQLLVACRANEPARGTLDLPGGFVDMDETGEEGMCREILEETGLQVSPQEVRYLFSIPNLYPYSGMTIHTLDMFYEVEVKASQLPHAADDAASLEWVPLNKVQPKQFGLQSISKAVERYLNSRTIPPASRA